MTTVGAHEARTRLSELLERVARGERITITRHGTPVARLIPVDVQARPRWRLVLKEARRFREGRKATPEEIRVWINERP